MEVSSYQLEDTPEFRPDISVLLNVTSDHLEHHKTMKAYIKAKENIFINQRFESVAIINYDNEICKKIALRLKKNKFCPKIFFFSRKPLEDGVFYNNGKIIISIRGERIKISPKINILGQHNIENILAATSVSYSMGIAPIVIEKIISKYKGVEHRIEFVRTLNGVNYYNDSKSTNVDSTRVALESFDKNILIIMGGRDKGVSYTSLKELVKHKVKSIFLIGEASNKIKKDLENMTTFFDCNNIENAIRQIVEVAAVGDIALLSPACASFDQFNDFEERGDVFKKIVNNLG
jgi:UDP-N-acetylmuramoylalanine--D-glutamate ligase